MKDPFGRRITNLRISVTTRCNLNCFYCHKEGQMPSLEEMGVKEIARVFDGAKASGITDVKITGGEPLMRRDIVDIVKEASKRFSDVSMTTNGCLLRKYSKDLAKAGLDRVNVSLDTLDRKMYKKLTGTDGLKEVIAGIKHAKAAGLDPIKINMLLIRDHNYHELDDMVSFCAKEGLTLQLIEYIAKKEGAKSRFYKEHHIDLCEVEARLEARARDIETRPMQKRKRYSIPVGKKVVTVEVVHPMHNSEFCRSCNRLRVTSNGYLKPCLMADGGKIDVLGPIRRGAPLKELKGLFKLAIDNKKPYWQDAGNLTDRELDIPALMGRLRNPKGGAVVTFIGTVRDLDQGKQVLGLELQAYPEMAEAELKRIIAEAKRDFDILDIVVKHRTGKLKVTDNIVFIGVSASHRGPAFDACRYIIEELKKRVPLFKLESTTAGKIWLKGEGHGSH